MRILKWYFQILTLLLLSAVGYSAGDITFPVQSQYLLHKNILGNPGFENGTNGFSGGGTVTGTTTFANVGSGKNAALWTVTGPASILSPSFTIPAGAYGRAGILQCHMKTSSTSLTLSAYNGSAIQSIAIPASSTFVDIQMLFNLPTSGSIQYQLSNSAGGTQTLYFDDCYIGAMAPTPGLWGTISVPIGTASCTWSITSPGSTYTSYSTVSACSSAMTATGNASTTGLPGIVFSNGLPPGTYQVFVQSLSSAGSANATCDWSLYDGSTNTGVMSSHSNSGVVDYTNNVVGYFSYPSGKSGSVTFQLQANSNGSTACVIDASTVSVGFNIQVYYWPL